MNKIRIALAEDQRDKTTRYAAQELEKYLTRILPPDMEMTGEISLSVEPSAFQAADPLLDDGIEISIQKGNGYIRGSNPRAVLIGVYRFLTDLGCRFIRPGPDGEVIPRLDPNLWNDEGKETAAHRHRGIVIEGANSLEMVLDTIEWMPKLGYNAFFTQFMSSSLFFERYYAHTHNPTRPPEPFDDNRGAMCEKQVWDAVSLRGLLHHAVGHGWTCEPFGIPARDWNQTDSKPDDCAIPLIAEIKGNRGFFEGIPIGTNLCYSNPKARETILDYAVTYIKAHPTAAYLHLWLADSIHSFCECDACREKSPSDWYIVLLNELDERLEQEGLSTHVVFLFYFDLLWPPIQEKLHHPERFTAMFAPITRPFHQAFAELDHPVEVKPYVLNETPIPRTIEENLYLLRKWEEVFKGDRFDFDYYLGRAHYGDFGYRELSRTICRDIEYLHTLGLDGTLSCQELRAYFPTALPNYVMGKKLWDPSCTFEQLEKEYMQAAFGEKWEACVKYLSAVSSPEIIAYWFGRCKGIHDKARDAALSAVKAAEAFQMELNTAPMTFQNECERLSWYYLGLHTEYVVMFGSAIAACAAGEREEAAAQWDKLAAFVQRTERSLERVLDLFRLLDLGSILSLHNVMG